MERKKGKLRDVEEKRVDQKHTIFAMDTHGHNTK